MNTRHNNRANPRVSCDRNGMNPGRTFRWALTLAVLLCGVGMLEAQTNDGANSAAPATTTNTIATNSVATNEIASAATNLSVSAAEPAKTDEQPATPEPKPAATGGPADFSAFRIVSERNIFNGNRAAGSGVRFNSTRSSTVRRDAVVESFTLVGVLVSDRSRTAFFDGSSPEFTGTLNTGEKLAGFQVKEILHTGVCLEEGTNTIEIAVGSGLRREDQGLWKHSDSGTGTSVASSWSGGGVQNQDRSSDNGGRSSWGRSSRNDGYTRSSSDSRPSGSSPATSSSSPPGDTDAILRRLREQREKE
jgi:hypothetical protein